MSPFILLIQPWIYDFAAYDLWIKPLGLLHIAAILKESGCGVNLVDCLDPDHPGMTGRIGVRQPSRKDDGRGQFHRREIAKPKCLNDIRRKYCRYGIDPDLFLEELRAVPRPNAVLITSTMTYWYPGVADCIRLTKEVFPDVPVVLGGVYATLCTDHARRHTGADYVLPGAFDDAALRTLGGIIGKSITPVSPGNAFPEPDCSVLRNRRVIPVRTSRGCPHRCPYCASALLHQRFLQWPHPNVADYIARWYAQGATDFVLYDDALLVNAERHFIPLFRELCSRGITARFHVPNGLQIRDIDDRIASLMREAGFATLRLSLETIAPDDRQRIGIKAGEEEFARVVASLRKAGFPSDALGVYIMAGLPFQKPDSVAATIRFVQSFGLRPLIAEYSPIPGTALWPSALACSRLPIEKEPLFHNNTVFPCAWESFTPDDMDALKRLARASRAA